MKLFELAETAAAQVTEWECLMMELAQELRVYEERMAEQEDRTRKAEAALQNLTEYMATFREREQQVKDAEEQIRKANAAREKAEEALAAMTQDRDKYKQLWEQARTQAAAAVKNAPLKKGNPSVQKLIEIEIGKRTTALEEEYQQKMKEQNAEIDMLNVEIASLTEENECLKKQLLKNKNSFKEENETPLVRIVALDDESGGIVGSIASEE